MSQDLFEIMRSTRSMRRLKPDPVPDALLRQVLEAGTCAANGGNMQSWRFLVIRDPAIKAAAGAWYRKAWHEIVGPRYRSSQPAPGTTRRTLRPDAGGGGIPRGSPPRGAGLDRAVRAGAHGTPDRRSFPPCRTSCWPAAPSASGRTLTTLHLNFEKEAEAAMGLPDDVHSYAILPIGYPMGKFGPVRRASLESVAYQDRWGEAYRGG